MTGQEAPALTHLLKLFDAPVDPTQDALYMWAAMWPQDQALQAAIVILMAGSVPHQHAVADTLRYLGFKTELRDVEGVQHWFVDGHDLEE